MTTENISERSEHYSGHRVVVAYINTLKTTLDYNFDLNQAFKHMITLKNEKAVN